MHVFKCGTRVCFSECDDTGAKMQSFQNPMDPDIMCVVHGSCL